MTFATVRDGRINLGQITPQQVPAFVRTCLDDPWVDSYAVVDGTTIIARWQR